MRMAVILDQLCGMAGTERVAQYICEEFAEADVFTLAYNPEATFPYFVNRSVKTTWLNRFVRSHNAFRWSFVISTYAMQRLNLKAYDVVLSFSSTVSKYVNVPAGRHICYCCMPTRALWHFDEYFRRSLLAVALRPVMQFLRHRDFQVGQKVDKFIAISNTSREYIRRYYGRPADVIYCPVDLSGFHRSTVKKEHYLIVSRLDRWKRTEYAIEAFNRLRLPLRVIGAGPEQKRLRAMAGRNITFVGRVNDETLAREYSEARAVIFTPFLEYGLIPLEANACGTPVICYGKGGVTETMIPAGASVNSPTAVFFYEQTAEALARAVREFERTDFDQDALVRHATRWNVPEFRQKMRAAVMSFVRDSASFPYKNPPVTFSMDARLRERFP